MNATYHVSTFFSGPSDLSVTAADIYGFVYYTSVQYNVQYNKNGRSLFKISSAGVNEKMNIPAEALTTVDKFGNVYFSKSPHLPKYNPTYPTRTEIFKYDSNTGNTTKHAGGLRHGNGWQDGNKNIATFNSIQRMFADTTGNLWIVDSLERNSGINWHPREYGNSYDYSGSVWNVVLYGNISSSTYSLKPGNYIRKISTNGFVATVAPGERINGVVDNYSDVFFFNDEENFVLKFEKTISAALGDTEDSKIYSAEVIDLKDSIF